MCLPEKRLGLLARSGIDFVDGLLLLVIGHMRLLDRGDLLGLCGWDFVRSWGIGWTKVMGRFRSAASASGDQDGSRNDEGVKREFFHHVF